MRPDDLDRARGALVGTALGDAFGAPYEGAASDTYCDAFLVRAERSSRWGYTDDTEMMFGVARSLIRERGVEPESMLRELATSYEPARGYGRGTRRCFEAYVRGVPWAECAAATWPDGSRGNGAAARTAPLVVAFGCDPIALRSAVDRASRITHQHDDAVLGALLQANAMHLAATWSDERLRPHDFLELLRSRVSDGWVDARISDVGSLVATGASSSEVVGCLGHGLLASESVACALWAFLTHPDSFADAVLRAANLGGDVDTICAMTGALVGARVGRSRLPERWIANLRHERPGVDQLDELAAQLHRRQAQLTPGPWAG